MTLLTSPIDAVPPSTAQVAKAAFPKGNIYLRMRDELGTIYDDDPFAALFPSQGKPALAPWRLALITIMQFAEGLTDRQAAEAVRGRIDWKYALSLELTDEGFDFTILTDFRSRLLGGGAEQQLLEKMLKCFQGKGLLKAPKQQRTDSTHVLAAIRNLSRLENVGETLRAALNSLAEVAPDWLGQIVPTDWYERYGQRFQESRLPSTETERQAMASLIGADGFYLLEAIWSETTPAWLRQVRAVEVLRQVWLQQYYAPTGSVQWRTSQDSPPTAQRIRSPYDTDARYGNKRTTTWTGYKVHLSETCDEESPHLITHVETTPATTSDREVTDSTHRALAKLELLPQEHLVDAGYLDAELLVSGQQEYELELLGPVPVDARWQSKSGQGYGIACFAVDWEAQVVRCPQGCLSHKWLPSKNAYQQPVIRVKFDKADCLSCLARDQCTRNKTGARTLTMRPKEQHIALSRARERQQTPEFKKQYAARAGIEGTISQGTRAFGLRHCRYRGFPKTRLQHIITAAAMNLVRVWQWWTQAYNFGRSCSRFASLAS